MQAVGSTEEEVCLHREKVPYNAFCFPKRLWSDLDLWSQVLRSKRDRLPNWPSILLRHSWNTGSLKEFWALLRKPKSHNCMSKCQSSQIQTLLTSWIWGSHWQGSTEYFIFQWNMQFLGREFLWAELTRFLLFNHDLPGTVISLYKPFQAFQHGSDLEVRTQLLPIERLHRRNRAALWDPGLASVSGCAVLGINHENSWEIPC